MRNIIHIRFYVHAQSEDEAQDKIKPILEKISDLAEITSKSMLKYWKQEHSYEVKLDAKSNESHSNQEKIMSAIGQKWEISRLPDSDEAIMTSEEDPIYWAIVQFFKNSPSNQN